VAATAVRRPPPGAARRGPGGVTLPHADTDGPPEEAPAAGSFSTEAKSRELTRLCNPACGSASNEQSRPDPARNSTHAPASPRPRPCRPPVLSLARAPGRGTSRRPARPTAQPGRVTLRRGVRPQAGRGGAEQRRRARPAQPRPRLGPAPRAAGRRGQPRPPPSPAPRGAAPARPPWPATPTRPTTNPP